MTAKTGKGAALHTKILAGLLIGGALGLLANTQLGGHHPLVEWMNRYIAYPAGQVFLRMLFMIVIPLVFASIALGVAGLGDLRRVGRVGGKTLGYFLVTTLIAASTGLLFVSVVKPGGGLDPAVKSELMEVYSGAASEKAETARAGGFGVDTFVNIVTRNPVRSAADGDLLGIIFFGMVFGAALTLIPAARAKPMTDLLESLNAVVISIVGMAMRLAPYGVTALIFGVTSRFGLALLAPLGGYIFVVLGALLFHALVNISLILRFVIGVSPRVVLSRARSALVTAFSTSSSSATLPASITAVEQGLGVPPQIAGFVMPLGATVCMNGTSIFEGVTVIFLCQVFGVDLSLVQMAVVMIMSVVTAVGSAGVPGGSIPLLVGILVMFGVPAEGIAVILGVDRILDMSRTVVNVYGDFGAALFVARSEGAWKPSMIPAAEKAPA
ncbi:MAG TPA: dicarboxylate/amino acid:cation symporter [Elusimicrobia bacterium]|nr:dicarboxylate/amino acid:cation symporter [Elusimicrobiota bacterium]